MRRLLLLSPLLLVAGCQDVQSTFNTHGSAADRIAPLSWLMTILFLVIIVIMWGLLWWAAVRRKGTLEEHAPIDIGGGQGWIAIGGLAIPLVVLCVLFVLGLRLLASFPIHDPMNQHAIKPDIVVIGHQWWWEVHYVNRPLDEQFTTANEIHIPVNKPVMFELRSQDVIHSFWVPSLHGKVDLIPGHPNYVQIQASNPGNYTGECAVYCGEQHAHMRLLVVAQTPDAYQAWEDGQVKPAAPPQSAAAQAGEQIFLGGPCAMCHQIRGTPAGGHVAPDLTHLASRQFIGADSFPNNVAYLEAWATHAQSLKPGCKMPDLTQFSGVQLQELVAYLQQLK